MLKISFKGTEDTKSRSASVYNYSQNPFNIKFKNSISPDLKRWMKENSDGDIFVSSSKAEKTISLAAQVSSFVYNVNKSSSILFSGAMEKMQSIYSQISFKGLMSKLSSVFSSQNAEQESQESNMVRELKQKPVSELRDILIQAIA